MNKTESDLFKALSKKIQKAGPGDAYSDDLELLPFDIAEVLAKETFRPTKSAVVKTVNAENTYQISLRDIAVQLPGAVEPWVVGIYLRSMGFTRIYKTKETFVNVVEWNEAQLELLGYARNGSGFHVYNGSPVYFVQQYGCVNAEQIETWLSKIIHSDKTAAGDEPTNPEKA